MDMGSFQYFFFDTYIGFFLQVLPIALSFGLICGLIRGRRREEGLLQTVCYSLFVAYITGLVGLVLFLDIIGDTWYFIFYHISVYDLDKFFTFDYDLIPDFWRHINGEKIGNIIMFIPFSILYPLAYKEAGFWRTVGSGAVCVCALELLQPIFGRAFDINDVILNLLGITVSACIFFIIKKRRQNGRNETRRG